MGWYAGVFALIATLAASLYTAYLLSALHEEPDGTRHNRYVDLGRAILGKHASAMMKLQNSTRQHTDVCANYEWSAMGSCGFSGDAWARWLITPLQYSVMIGLAVAYLVTAGQSFQVHRQASTPFLTVSLYSALPEALPKPCHAAACSSSLPGVLEPRILCGS